MKAIFDRYVVKDWKLKLLSLVLAIMLWYTVYQIGEPKKDITVPLSIANLPRNMVIMKMDPERVFLTVRGRVSMLTDIRERDVSVFINMNGIKEGETIFDISRSNVTVPRGIDVVDVRPGTVKMVVDRIVEKKLKVVPVLDKKWATHYDIGSVNPPHVIAEGPRKVLEKATTIATLPVNGDFKRNDESVNAGFNMEDLPRVKVRPDSVRISLKRRPGNVGE